MSRPAFVDTSDNTIRLMCDLQREAFRTRPFPSLADRRDILRRLLAVHSSCTTDYNVAVRADYGGHRSAHTTAIADHFTAAKAVRDAIAQVEQWMAPRSVDVGAIFAPATAFVQPQPLGVVVVFAPYNFPLSMSFHPIAAALAAGNRVILKPSERCPRAALVLQKYIADHFDPSELVVVCGGSAVGATLASLPGVDKIFFTGGHVAARHILRAAAENLTPVALELGGKCPMLIHPDYNNLPLAARSFLALKLINGGQLCVAPDYLLLHEDMRQAFIEALRIAADDLFPTGLLSEEVDLTAPVDERHYRQCLHLLEDAKQRGATSLTVGRWDRADLAKDDVEGLRIPFTLLLDVTGDMDIMKQEVFGTIVPVVTFTSKDIDEPLAYIADSPERNCPLAMYYFDDDRQRQTRVAREVSSGGLTIGDVALHPMIEGLPFGGVGKSGRGRLRGKYGFDEMSNLKAVAVQSKLQAYAKYWGLLQCSALDQAHAFNAISPVAHLPANLLTMAGRVFRSFRSIWS